MALSPTQRRALLLAVPTVPLAVLLPMVKPEPIYAGLVIVAAVVATSLAAPRSRFVGVVRLLALLALSGLGLVVVMYGVLVTIAPPVTADGHRVMPLGQAIGAYVLGVPIAVVVLRFYVRRAGRDPRVEAAVLAVWGCLGGLAALMSAFRS